MTATWSGINRSTMMRQPNPPEGPICIKNEYTTSFRLDPNDPPNSDGREFDAMSDEERHQAALSDPAYPPATAAQLACARSVHTVLPRAKTWTRICDRQAYSIGRREARSGIKAGISSVAVFQTMFGSISK